MKKVIVLFLMLIMSVAVSAQWADTRPFAAPGLDNVLGMIVDTAPGLAVVAVGDETGAGTPRAERFVGGSWVATTGFVTAFTNSFGIEQDHTLDDDPSTGDVYFGGDLLGTPSVLKLGAAPTTAWVGTAALVALTAVDQVKVDPTGSGYVYAAGPTLAGPAILEEWDGIAPGFVDTTALPSFAAMALPLPLGPTIDDMVMIGTKVYVVVVDATFLTRVLEYDRTLLGAEWTDTTSGSIIGIVGGGVKLATDGTDLYFAEDSTGFTVIHKLVAGVWVSTAPFATAVFTTLFPPDMDMVFDSVGDLYVPGLDPAGPTGVVEVYNGATWSILPTTYNQILTEIQRIAINSNDDVLALGYSGIPPLASAELFSSVTLSWTDTGAFANTNMDAAQELLVDSAGIAYAAGIDAGGVPANVQSLDTFGIAIPEFTTITLVLAALVALGGMFVMRRRV